MYGEIPIINTYNINNNNPALNPICAAISIIDKIGIAIKAIRPAKNTFPNLCDKQEEAFSKLLSKKNL